MAFDITQNALNASKGSDLIPNIVLEIDGISQLFGAALIQSFIRYGDPDLEYGEGDVYGGLRPILNQKPYISFDKGTSTTISQQLHPEKGTSDSVSSVKIAMIDFNGELTKIFAPDETQSPPFDVLGRRARIYFGFQNTAWPEDYITVFRGNIESLDQASGLMSLQINAPDNKKKGVIFQPEERELTLAMTSGDTVLNIDDTTNYLDPTTTGPSGSIDPDLKYYVRVDDELIQYTAKTGTQLQGLVRGQFGTTPSVHDSDTSVESLYVISGNAIDLALKFMMSGRGGFYQEDVDVSAFLKVSPTDVVPETIYFKQIDLFAKYGITVGDYVSITGATNGANNVSLIPIVAITKTEDGSFLTLPVGTGLIQENTTAALISFRSRYDVWPQGAAMHADEVDIEEHNFIKRIFLSETEQYRFFLYEEIELKEFIGEQIYNPLSAYSVPRKAQSSIGYHKAGLIPGGFIPKVSSSNVTNAPKLKITRSTSKNFYNAVLYKFDENILEVDKFIKYNSTLSTDSRNRIDVGSRTLTIASKGLRSDLQGEVLSNNATANRLQKYKFGAEFIRKIKLDLKTGFQVEIGDLVLLDISSLQISDKNSGTRAGESRLFQIDNKSFNMRSGEVIVDLVDTNFDKDTRFGLISPASYVKTGLTERTFIISPSFNTTQFGTNEFLKYENYIGTTMRVRNDDFSINGTAQLIGLSGNTVTLGSDLGFIPTANMIFEFADYDTQSEDVKLIYVSMSDTVFADGKQQYQML